LRINTIRMKRIFILEIIVSLLILFLVQRNF
jgi:hypothetical protein